jgi:protein-ribulosamine 3-kinase
MQNALLEAALQNHFRSSFKISSISPISGGSINYCYCIVSGNQKYFLKYNEAEIAADLFAKEMLGLQLLQSTQTFKIPEIIYNGNYAEGSFLLLEYLEKHNASTEYWQKAGEQLAALHQHTATSYGLEYDNYIGSLPQSNKQYARFYDFFVYERLEPLVRLGEKNGYFSCSNTDQFESIYTQLPRLLPHESPALLHGDLWSGNIFSDSNKQPVIFDPAVYYGNREAELAFTTLFDKFHQSFYEAYNSALPMQNGYEERFPLYNLYPLLVHLHLFGSSYLQPILQTLKRFA